MGAMIVRASYLVPAVATVVPVLGLWQSPTIALLMGEPFSPSSMERPVLYATALLVCGVPVGLVAACLFRLARHRMASAVCLAGVVACVGAYAGAVAGWHLLFGHTLNGTYDRYFGIAEHATTWSVEYDEAAFSRIRPGWTRSEVIAAAGTPLSSGRICGFESLTYTKSAASRGAGRVTALGDHADGYHQRLVLLDGGTVIRVVRRYRTLEQWAGAGICDPPPPS